MGATVSRITTGDLNGDLVISAFSIRVESVLIANSTAGSVDVTLEDASGVTVATISVGIGVSQDWYPNCMFDNGLTIASASSAAVFATVTHSADGA